MKHLIRSIAILSSFAIQLGYADHHGGSGFNPLINGRVMSIGIDEDEINFRKDGLIGFQLHGGRPMKIEVKDLRIRELAKL